MPDPNAAGTTGNPSPAPDAGGAAGAAGAGPGVDFKTLKFDGEGVPEKFKGKTMAEIAQIYADVEAAKTKHEQINKKWNDWYQAEYYANLPPEDPTGPASGTNRVVRDRCYREEDAQGFRWLWRWREHPDAGAATLGFRVAISVSR